MENGNSVGEYVDALSLGNKISRLAWGLFVFFFFRPFVGPVFRYYRSFVLRIWGAKIGRRCAIAAGAKIWAPWNLQLGDYVAIANGAELYNVAPIRIGNHVAVSQQAYICTASHDISKLLIPLVKREIEIQDFAWICARAIILPGVRVGEGSVVGCSAVVTKNVAPWTVVAGNPASVIKRRELCHD